MHKPRKKPERALANIREAIEGYLEAFPEELNQLNRKRELVEVMHFSVGQHTRVYFPETTRTGFDTSRLI